MTISWIVWAIFLAESAVIENPLSQKPSMEMVFTEELTITSESDDRAFFGGRFLDLDVDPQGKMYVVHGTENQIIIFNADGQINRILGGRGQGPGEFENLRGFKILDDGTALALESANNVVILHYFDKDLKFISSQKTQTPFTFFDWIPTSDGQYFAGLLTQFGTEKQTNKFGLVSKEMKELFIPHQYDVPNVLPMDIESKEFWLKFIPSRLKVQAQGDIPFMALDSEGYLYTAIGKTYEITKWSSTGEKMLSFRKAYKPKYQTDEDIQAIIAPLKESLQSQVPAVREMFNENFLDKVVKKSGFTRATHPIQGLRVTDDGYILVIHEHSFLTRDASADVFSPKGVFMGKAHMKDNGFRIIIFRKGKAYSLSQNEDDEWYLVRFKYDFQRI